ncbi:hypothetical protein [Haloarchaeobius sp. DYHT-AS-18]|uniref:hypothetical protein n=1 Tax=Haloarchaeobius sp. DYHT-AS-18 TaxID=3446117 RepID=UPI003EB6DAFB
MGDSVWGAVEVNVEPDGTADPWFLAASLRPFVGSWWYAWQCLFGWEDDDVFDPVSPDGRGLPDDLSSDVERHYHEVDSWGENHVTLAELRAVDWQEVSPRETILWQRREAEGLECPLSGRDEDALSTEQLETLDAGGQVTTTTYVGHTVTVTRERLTREFVCRAAGWWWVIHELMEHLTDRIYRPEGVRLVVWRW